jgi:hypothetical protein
LRRAAARRPATERATITRRERNGAHDDQAIARHVPAAAFVAHEVKPADALDAPAAEGDARGGFVLAEREDARLHLVAGRVEAARDERLDLLLG